MVDVIGPEVTSSNPFSDFNTLDFTDGVWQYEVRVFDGEFWSPYSASVNFTVTAAVHARVPTLGTVSSAPGASPDYTNGVYLEVGQGSASVATITPWTSRPEVTSGNPFGDVDMSEILVSGQIEWQVRASDAEGTGPWSTTSTVITVSTNYNGRVPTQSIASAPGAVPDYTNGVRLEMTQASASAATTTPFTHLFEVTSASPFGDTPVLALGTIEFQARLADVDGWGPWSATSVTMQGTAATNLMIFLNGAWYEANRFARRDPNWVRHKSRRL